MVNLFRGTEQCRELTQPDKNGFLQVTHNSVTWKIFVAQGKLRYATNSVQNIETLNYHLGQLGHGALPQLEADDDSMNPASWGAVHKTIEHLLRQGAVDAEGGTRLTHAIAQDALESLLWLSEGTAAWHEEPNASAADEMPALTTVLDNLAARLKSWQALTPVIQSPHQQPYCPDPAKLNQPVPNGMLNQGLLSMLSQLMQNNSIARLSLFLKQDSLKLAQLLYPYIQQQLLVLQEATAPFNLLPQIPAVAQTEPQPSQAQPQLSQAQPRVQLADRASAKRKKIVCIDDSPAMLETIEAYLGAEGFEVATVENPMESLSTMFSMKPDLILMDVSMPGINGNSLCQILKRSSVFKEVPIIMVSGNTGALDKTKSEASGAAGYLTKPFSKVDLLAIVETHLKTAVPS